MLSYIDVFSSENDVHVWDYLACMWGVSIRRKPYCALDQSFVPLHHEF